MSHPALPTPEDISRGIELLDIALRESSLPPAAFVAVTAILGALEAAADVLDESAQEFRHRRLCRRGWRPGLRAGHPPATPGHAGPTAMNRLRWAGRAA